MVAPKHVRRSDEIKRLTEQLEELRAKREQIISTETSSTNASTSQSTPPPPVPSSSPPSVPPVETLTIPTSVFSPGKHSSESHFLSISSVASDEYHPRVLLLAGTIPILTSKEFKEVPSMLYSKEPKKGNLMLSRLPEGFVGDFVTMPTFEVLFKCGDPVAILIPPEKLSAAKLPITATDNVILVVDRDVSNFKFESNCFYAWDVDGMIQIGWVDELPSTDIAKIVGKVVYGHIEVDVKLRARKSCFEEENELYS